MSSPHYTCRSAADESHRCWLKTYILSFHRILYATVMCTDMSQVGIELSFFLTFHLSRFSFYINNKIFVICYKDVFAVNSCLFDACFNRIGCVYLLPHYRKLLILTVKVICIGRHCSQLMIDFDMAELSQTRLMR